MPLTTDLTEYADSVYNNYAYNYTHNIPILTQNGTLDLKEENYKTNIIFYVDWTNEEITTIVNVKNTSNSDSVSKTYTDTIDVNKNDDEAAKPPTEATIFDIMGIPEDEQVKMSLTYGDVTIGVLVGDITQAEAYANADGDMMMFKTFQSLSISMYGLIEAKKVIFGFPSSTFTGVNYSCRVQAVTNGKTYLTVGTDDDNNTRFLMSFSNI